MTALMIGSPGSGELLVLFVVILILFGPRQIPSIARSIGHLLAQLRRASQDFSDQLMRVDIETGESRPAAGHTMEADVVRDVTEAEPAHEEETVDDGNREQS